MSEKPLSAWISALEAGRILDATPVIVARLAKQRRITVKSLPGCPPRFSRADCERLASQSVVPASEDNGATV